MTKTQAISMMILAKVAAGMSVREAFNAVLGPGRFEQLASDLYDELRARN
jgi:tetrahydromethanopterin S-methyltransferase subunit C